MKIQDLLLKFQGVKQVSENQYMAICPAHDDHRFRKAGGGNQRA